jgi:hypothetical protein
MNIDTIQLNSIPSEMKVTQAVNEHGYRIPAKRVSSSPISFHQPLHWFLGLLIRHLGHPEVKMEGAEIWNRIFPLHDGSRNQVFEDAIMQLVDPCNNFTF